MKENFPKVTAKQWKQKLQFLLNGADYNETLLWKSNEDIAVTPFYSDEKDIEKPFFSDIKTRVIGSLYISDIHKSLQEIEQWNKKNVRTFILKVSREELCLSLFLELPNDCKYIIEIPNYSFFDINNFYEVIESRSLDVTFHCDILGNFTRFGNWFDRKQQDLANISSFLKEKESSIIIDSRIFQEAGASIIQQIAYSISIFIEYSQYLNTEIIQEKTLLLYVSVGKNYFFEIAKLRAFRWIFQRLKEMYGISFQLQLIAQPSKRELMLSNVDRNHTKIELAMEMSVLGSADYVLPIQPEFYKRDTFDRVEPMLMIASNLIEEYNFNSIEDSYYIDALTFEITEKALKLAEETQQSKGYLQVLKSHLLQKKIKEKAVLEEEPALNSNKKYVSEDEWELFPFVKRKSRKTLMVPIFPYRISEKEEKKYYNK